MAENGGVLQEASLPCRRSQGVSLRAPFFSTSSQLYKGPVSCLIIQGHVQISICQTVYPTERESQAGSTLRPVIFLFFLCNRGHK